MSGPGSRVAGVARAVAIVGTSYLVGAVPFSQIAARLFAGTDLRHVGSGTVSGTSLNEVAGFGPLALAGVLEVGKGSVGPLLAGRDHPCLRAVAIAAAVTGHNWSPYLRGAGGRGLSPALGAMSVCAPEAAALLAGGMAAGRVLHESGAVTLLCALGLLPLLGARRGLQGVVTGLAVVVPMIGKRLVGNRRAVGAGATWSRLVYDRDGPPAPHACA